MGETIKKVRKKIKQSIKQKEIKMKTNKRIQSNVLIAIILMIHFLAISVTYQKLGEELVLNALEIISMVILFIGIIVMERAYKKDNGELAIYSIEILIIAAHTLSIQYVVTKFDFSLPLYVTVSSYVFAIYYVFKSIIIYTKQRREYLDSFSDIPEITKKEKPIVKEAKKRTKTKDSDEEGVNLKKKREGQKRESQKREGEERESEIREIKIKEKRNVNKEGKANNKEESINRRIGFVRQCELYV